MKFSQWNDDEKMNYDNLCKGSDISSLAYTAVMEMYHGRKLREQTMEHNEAIFGAIGKMAEGIAALERLLGISVSKMADDQFSKEMERARKCCEECMAKRLATATDDMKIRGATNEDR